MAPWTYGDPYLTVMQQLRIAAARALGPYDYERFNASLVFPPGYRRANEAGFTRLAEKAAAPDADRIADRLNGILAFDARPILPAIACPALVVAAIDDQLMPVWFGREMAAAIPGARLIELAEAGHMIPETQGPELAARVADFFTETEPR
jgi:aminoacrylate hydrolase